MNYVTRPFAVGCLRTRLARQGAGCKTSNGCLWEGGGGGRGGMVFPRFIF